MEQETLKVERIVRRPMMNRRGMAAGRIIRWGPVACYVLLIFALSSMSNPPGVGSIQHLDKVAHFFEYGILGCLLAWAVGVPTRGKRAWVIFFAALVVGACVGLADELYQGTVPGRQKSPWDFLADMGGLAVFQMLFLRWALLRAKRTERM
jgi:VanZ family protein